MRTKRAGEDTVGRREWCRHRVCREQGWGLSRRFGEKGVFPASKSSLASSSKFKPVIKKAMVKLEGAPFKKFASQREEWVLKNRYISPGPNQFKGPGSDAINHTLLLELGAQA
ncbi:hypothetical protein Bca4012_019806 [Brassica carinata]|uniref:Uncharacterized protein n=1 Tax=Brassica carinata TaxID=52824 RepID=A0A8X7WJ91_BRACI|nr:hypothetical protein Bca52824_001786 [Brassica carinata]